MGSTVSANSQPSPFIIPGPTTPDMDNDPTFDKHLGFQGERKERVMAATEEAFISTHLPLKHRDYCAHLFINYEACKRDKFPFVYRCKHEKHEFQECEFEDQILRMKEFERERRLLERQERLKKKAHRQASDDDSS